VAEREHPPGPTHATGSSEGEAAKQGTGVHQANQHAARRVVEQAKFGDPPPYHPATWWASPQAGAELDRDLNAGRLGEAIEKLFWAWSLTAKMPPSLLTAERATRLLELARVQAPRYATDIIAQVHAKDVAEQGAALVPAIAELHTIFVAAMRNAVRDGLLQADLSRILAAFRLPGDDLLRRYGQEIATPNAWPILRELIESRKAELLAEPEQRRALLVLIMNLPSDRQMELGASLFGIAFSKSSHADLDPRLAGAITSGAARVPERHSAFLGGSLHVEGVGGDQIGTYNHDVERGTIPTIRLPLEKTDSSSLVHELGHALDDRLGFPSRRTEIFGWRELHSAAALAEAADLASVSMQAPEDGKRFLRAYEQLYKGKRDWTKILAEVAGGDSQWHLRWARHSAYLAGSASDDTRDDHGPADPALTPSELVMFHGYYNTGYALTRPHYELYVQANLTRAYYAPGECFAAVYERLHPEGSLDNRPLPPTVLGYFKEVVEPFGAKPRTG
jgi:hypothetical protein